MAVFANNFRTALASSITTTDTTITVSDVSDFVSYADYSGIYPSTSDPAYLTIDDGANIEVVAATGYNANSNTFTVVRNADFTTITAPFSFAAGALVELRLPAVVLSGYVASSLNDAFVINSAVLGTFETDGSVAIEGTLAGRRTVTLGSRSDEECAHVGWRSESVTSDRTVSMGYQAKASGYQGIAIGHTADSSGDGAIAIGTESIITSSEQSVGIGYKVGSGSTETILTGGGVYVGAYSGGGNFAVAVGRQADAQAESVAIGSEAGASQNGVAVGFSSVAGERSVNINASFTQDDAVGIGAPAYTPFLSNTRAPNGLDRIGRLDADTRALSSAQVTLEFTVPVNIGDQNAFNAATLYFAGDVVTEGGHQYYLAENTSLLENALELGLGHTLTQATPDWSLSEHAHTVDTTWVRANLLSGSDYRVDMSFVRDYFVVEEIGVYSLSAFTLTSPASIQVGTFVEPQILSAPIAITETTASNRVLTFSVANKPLLSNVRFTVTPGSGATATVRFYVRGFYVGRHV